MVKTDKNVINKLETLKLTAVNPFSQEWYALEYAINKINKSSSKSDVFVQHTSDIIDDEDEPVTAYLRIPDTGIGDLSDGYHTFNDLYYQRLVLFATIVNSNPLISWKSYKHEDGKLCFGGGWFIVGVDTPEGPYTYHYENKYFDMFKCQELEVAKHFDGHTDKDVTRLLSLCKENDDEK